MDSSTDRIYLLLASSLVADRTGPDGGFAAEEKDIAVEVSSPAALARIADAGALADMMTVLLVLALHHRRPDLFTG